MTERLVLHEYASSGNCYKVRLAAACVQARLERREYDILKGETRTPQFLANVDANGRIPVLQVDDRFIPESNAACYFVAEGSNLIPTDPFDHADMYAPRASLDRHYTIVGRVISGMDAVDKIAPGEPPEAPTKIVHAYVGK